MDPRCPRCGAARPVETDLPCDQCWEARGDERLVRLLVGRIEAGSRQALRLLAWIGDPAAAPALRETISHSDPHVRAAAINSLGWSGDRSDVARVIPSLGDPDDDVRMAARATLADLGGEEAADALAAGIDGLEGEEQVHAVEALAWLRDPRAIERLHELVPEQLGEPVPPRYRRGVVSLLARIGSRADVLRMADEAVTAITAGTGSFRDQRIADDLWLALHRERPELMQEVGDRLRDAVPELPALARWPGNERAPRVTFVEPHGERVVPRVTLAELSDTPVPGSSSPPAKFGGQPDWVAEPTWPLGAEFTPLVFYGQLPAGPGRMAYIFIDPEGRHWEPLGEANAVVIQPGARCHLETAPLSAGPQLFEHYAAGDGFRHRRRARPYERFIRLEEGADPECWDWPELAPNTYPTNPPGDWNKLGGTPLFLQGEEHPPGEGWLYAFQFTAGWAGRELGDGAECYGFIREDGSGAFLWQCH